MLVLRPGRRCQAIGRAAATALAPVLGGCSDASPTWGGWIYAALATTALTTGGYLLGRWRARAAASDDLRRAREALRLSEQLQSDWAWETDTEHRLLAWRGPAGTGGEGGEPLFPGGAAAPGLAARLQARQPFSGLRLHAARAQDGSHGWDCRGLPRWDGSGAFAGYGGRAQPTDAADALRAAAAALHPALEAHDAPALAIRRSGAGWRLLAANGAARTNWPALASRGDIDAVLADLPVPVAEACQELASGSTHDSLGWQVSVLGGLAEDQHAVLLLQQLAPDPAAAGRGAAAPAPGAAETSDGDTFSFTVSHDLRAPIRVVEGFTRIVKEDYGRLLDRVGNDHLDRVLGAAARMNLMIDALLTLARLSSQPLARQPVNLSQLAGWVVDDLRRGAPERVAEVEIEPGLAATGDPTLLRQVLENLLGNAWKYTARRERAQISLRRLEHDGRAVYEVRDNGAGFDMRSADRLFGLFQRLHSASDFPGNGVGLASVRRIVRRHGGDIWAESEPGRGAAFHFTLG